MHPEEQFDGDLTRGPPWTPRVWQVGPDQLIAEAQRELWADRIDINTALGPGFHPPAFSGSVNQQKDETEEDLNPASPPDGPGVKAWRPNLKNLESTKSVPGLTQD